jgi:nitroreductase
LHRGKSSGCPGGGWCPFINPLSTLPNMDFAQLLLTRQSVRRYSDQAVAPEKIDQLIEAVRLAPSASNSQPWKLILVTDPVLRDQVARATFSTLVSFNAFVLQAPVLAVLVIEKPKIITQIGGRLKNRDFPLIDIGIAAEHFCLQAAELGLGTCMLGWFDEPLVQQLLQIPKEKRVGLIISLGYDARMEPPRPKNRKSREAMSSFNRY